MPTLADTIRRLQSRQPAMATPSIVPSMRLRRLEDFGSNPGALDGWSYIPSDAEPTALVVVLHGCTQTAAGYDRGSGWSDLAEAHGFAVLFPEQRRANNPNLCFNWFQGEDTRRDGGEALSIRQMIEAVVVRHRIDRRRVFVTGLSAGGAMANVMLATYPEVFAAGAIVAGLPYGAASNMGEAFAAMKGASGRPAQGWGSKVRAASSHRGPWPRVSVWQGDKDAIVAPSVAEDVALQWADVHVARREEPLHLTSGRSQIIWRTATGETVVELHRIADMAHGTALDCREPNGCGRAGPYLLDVGVSSSTEIAGSWGLITTRRPTHVRPRPVGPPVSADGGTFYAANRPAHDISGVIASALRSAGLMK